MPRSLKINITISVLLSLLIYSLGVAGDSKNLVVKYLGAITDDLYSPTTLEIYDDELVILEPFSDQIKKFTDKGVITGKMHLSAECSGLARLSADEYVFCDRERNTVVKVNLQERAQVDYLSAADGVSDPTDLVFDGVNLHVLDNGSKAILSYDINRSLISRINLNCEENDTVKYANSFDYDPVLRHYFVLDQISCKVCVFNSEGSFIRSLGSFGAGDGQVSRAGELCYATAGFILISDRFQGRVCVYDTSGIFYGYIADNESDFPVLDVPTGLAVDDNNTVYIVSTMKPAINIYYVDLKASQQQLLAAQPLYPEDQAELRPEEIELVAYAQNSGTVEQIIGFNFQLFDNDNPDFVLDESGLIKPESENQSDPESQIITGRWRPSIENQIQRTFMWRARILTSNLTGEWSAKRTFSVHSVPREFSLKQNYPNPFNPSTYIPFVLQEESEVLLEVYDLLGRRIDVLFDGKLETGEYKILWDGKNDSGSPVSSGVYFYRIQAGDFTQTKKMVLMR